MLRALILGVPRSGKSRLASRLAASSGASHYPVDSLVSAFGEAFPHLGIGREYADSESTVRIAEFLRCWRRHLDFEQRPYVVEGYHIQVFVASEFAASGVAVAAVGYPEVDIERKCAEIRSRDQEPSWTAALSASDLRDLVTRYRAESRDLKQACFASDLPYFDVGEGEDESLEAALSHLAGDV